MNATTRREEELFETARRMTDASKRAAFLDFSCPDDPAARARIERLLGASEGAERFFEEGASYVQSSELFARLRRTTNGYAGKIRSGDGGEETVGLRIGRYKLLQRIGDGGCGVVYLAEQEEPVRRQVALKIIRVGMETRSVIARFEAERQALAMMDHPHIARVFDAGETGRGAPYFVMEHVRGERITEYCDRHNLALPERLDLFIQTCHAIQHAHQKGIIHGDVKPSNILVTEHDGVPAPKVIDFGISKATEVPLDERMLMAVSDQPIGTPAYMSPEQVEKEGGGIDTRSDIYSLGILLFELLTGRTPYEDSELLGEGLDGMRRTLSAKAHPAPSAKLALLPREELLEVASDRKLEPLNLMRRLRGDLDSIAMKALAKDRRRRYETADALAADVKRHLCHEPVAAVAGNWTYSFRKLVRRNRGVFVASAAVTFALVAGFGVSTVLFFKEREARQRAVAAEQQQARMREQAELSERITQGAFLVSQDRFDEAEALLHEIQLSESTLEGAAVYRNVGEWHAVNGRWQKAADRFEALLEVHQLAGADVTSLDYLELGPALIESGDLERYERFREAAVERFAATPSPFSDRIVKIALLVPAPPDLIERMRGLADLTAAASMSAETAGDGFQAAWRSMSMALYCYRAGDTEGALRWGYRCVSFDQANGPRNAAAWAILALVHQQRGEAGQAAEALAESAAILEPVFAQPLGRGNPVQGFWFDWVFAKILLREAERRG